MTRTRPYIIAFAASALFAGASLPALAAGMDNDRRGDNRQIQRNGGHDRGSLKRSIRQAPSAGARNRASQVRSHTSSSRPQARSRPVSQSRPSQTRPSHNGNRPRATPNRSPGRLAGGPGRTTSGARGSARPAVVTRSMNLRNRTFPNIEPRGGGHSSPGRPSTPRHDGGNDHNYGGNGGRGDHDRGRNYGGRADRDGHDGYRGGHNRGDRYNGHRGGTRHYSYGSRKHYGSNRYYGSKRYYGNNRYYGRNYGRSNVGFSLNFVFPSANHYSSQYGYFSPVRYWCPLHGYYHEGYYAPYRYDSRRSYVYYGYDDYSNGYGNYAQNCEYRYVRTRYDWDREQVCYDGRGRIYVRY